MRPYTLRKLVIVPESLRAGPFAAWRVRKIDPQPYERLTMTTIYEMQMAEARKNDAARAYSKAIIAACPLGRVVKWKHGAQVQSGEVVMHDHGERVRVRNVRSGKEQWLYATRIIA